MPLTSIVVELMYPTSKKSTTVPTKGPREKPIIFQGRDGLGAYSYDPAAFPPSRVITYNDSYVVVNDLYPKSSVHALLLPRSPKNLLHPFEAFEDADLLAATITEANKLRALVAGELRRRYGKFSKQEQARERALNGEVEIPEGGELPPGRDWEKEVMVGIHAHPSMNHVHVHVLSVDRHSEYLRSRSHYNSFSTPFLVPLDAFPLSKDDPRRHPGREGYLNRDLKCWRCEKEFGRSFVNLREHLALEFEEWKRE